jgi:hypothetical protein
VHGFFYAPATRVHNTARFGSLDGSMTDGIPTEGS